MDYAPVARRLYSLLRDLGAEGAKVTRLPRGGFRVSGLAPPLRTPSPAARESNGYPATRCCKRSYVRGSFLARGFLSLTRHGYHWEIKTPSEEQAGKLRKVLESQGLRGARVGRWQKGWVVYLKDAEQICAWLGLVGAHETLLELESTRVEKEMRNKVNRRVNYETANLARTVAAAMRQKNDIKLIDKTLGLASLPPALKDLAEARLAQPLASLGELAASLHPPLSKPGASYRMRQISALAERIRSEQSKRTKRS